LGRKTSAKGGPVLTKTSIAAVLAAGVGLLGLAGCGGGKNEESAATGTPEKTFQVVETEFKLTPSTFTIDKAGTYAFEAKNSGQAVHSLEIEGNGVEAKLESDLEPGESGTVTVDLKPGTYEMYCPVDGHKDQGMEGSIGVERSPAASNTQEDSGGNGTGGYGSGN
jgi:VCBS repeat-containing protein